jgi:restriction system protein
MLCLARFVQLFVQFSKLFWIFHTRTARHSPLTHNAIIYIQAKRWQSTVGRPEIQKFVGALHGKNARKGIFITTSDFTNGATQYDEGLSDKVVLIDGETLANLMIDHGVGVALEEAYE